MRGNHAFHGDDVARAAIPGIYESSGLTVETNLCDPGQLTNLIDTRNGLKV